MATLYIVPTPIGNLEDITLRALRVLGEVDIIACEDTRVTKKLLDKYEINTQTISYHAQSDTNKEDQLIRMIQEGKSVALVSDAGTPTISDPGVRLIARLYAEVPDIQIESLPGPSALTAALAGSGISSADFRFMGFVPQKKGRQTFFENLTHATTAVVFYESVHRILKTLESLAETLPKERLVVVARELSKMHEQFVRGNGEEVLQYFTENPDKVRGEFVVIVDA